MNLSTHSQLTDQLRDLGLRPGAVVMVHAGMRSVGPVLGGPDVLIQSILDVLRPGGTVMMYVGWEELLEELGASPDHDPPPILDQHPAFDPATSRALRGHGILAEMLRTWPGAQRSDHPEASIAAVGARAAWITAEHPLRDGYGHGSPLARLVEARGQVLMVGAPLSTVTLIHHAEHIADLPAKRRERFRMPMLRNGERVWVDVEQYDTNDGVVDGGYTLEQIAGEYVDQGHSRLGKVGRADAHLFDAIELVAFAVRWLESRYGRAT